MKLQKSTDTTPALHSSRQTVSNRCAWCYACTRDTKDNALMGCIEGGELTWHMRVETSSYSMRNVIRRKGILRRFLEGNADSPRENYLIHAICRRLFGHLSLFRATYASISCLSSLLPQRHTASLKRQPLHHFILPYFVSSFRINQPSRAIASVQLSYGRPFCEISTCRAGNREQSQWA